LFEIAKNLEKLFNKNVEEMVEKILNSLLERFHQSRFFEGLKKYKF